MIYHFSPQIYPIYIKNQRNRNLYYLWQNRCL